MTFFVAPTDPFSGPLDSILTVLASAVHGGEETDACSSAALDPLVARAAGGDREALREVLLKVQPRVRNLVRYLVRGDRAVDDLAQEALVAIVRGIGSFRGDGAFDAWVGRVTARAVFAAIRRDRKEEATAMPSLNVVASEEDRPDRYVTRRRAARMLDSLPYDQRHAVVLHFVLGMTVPEIASELSIPRETVRSRLRLGLRKLRAVAGVTGETS